MADKISLYGLSGSGKSCFIFAMSQALSQGIRFSDGELMTVITPNPRQMIRLYKAYQQLADGIWPSGNIESVTYNFNVRKALELLMDIEITDYRGALLDSDDDDDADEQAKLYNSYKDSKAILFFFGADTIKSAMSGDTTAHFNFMHFNALYAHYLTLSPQAKETPVMLIISKADMLTPTELSNAFAYVKSQMGQFFQTGTNLTVGLTAVSLGSNLTNEGGELEGELDIRAEAGNLSIPILFALYHVMAQRIERSINTVSVSQSALQSSHSALNKTMAHSSFYRFFFCNETDIRQRIQRQSQCLDKEKDLLQRLTNSMYAIKSYLLANAEIYFNGQRVK
jgi:hypothetical protein